MRRFFNIAIRTFGRIPIISFFMMLVEVFGMLCCYYAANYLHGNLSFLVSYMPYVALLIIIQIFLTVIAILWAFIRMIMTGSYYKPKHIPIEQSLERAEEPVLPDKSPIFLTSQDGDRRGIFLWIEFLLILLSTILIYILLSAICPWLTTHPFLLGICVVMLSVRVLRTVWYLIRTHRNYKAIWIDEEDSL